MNSSRLHQTLGSLFRRMPKFHYAVRTGRSVGVYESWDDCRTQVNGFQGARYKKFATAQEAWAFVNAEADPNPNFKRSGGSSARCQSRNHSTGSENYAAASMSSAYSSKRKFEATVEQEASYSTSYKKTKYTASGYSTSYSASSSLSFSAATSSSAAALSSSSSSTGRAVVYTDGSCESNGRRGARAGVGVYWGEDNPYNVSERLGGRQTNQRAEITAAIRALETAKSKSISDLTLYTDSKYTMNAINDWIHRWKVNGWKTVGNKDVTNKEDLQTLDSLCQEVKVDWKYVPGHANIKGNEAADTLAKAGARMPPS